MLFGRNKAGIYEIVFNVREEIVFRSKKVSNVI